MRFDRSRGRNAETYCAPWSTAAGHDERRQEAKDDPTHGGSIAKREYYDLSRMVDQTITGDELLDNLDAVLSAAEAGQSFIVTIREQPVARIVPPDDPVWS